MIASLDMIMFKLILANIQYYSGTHNDESLEKINAAFEILKFGVGNMLVTFQEKFYILSA